VTTRRGLAAQVAREIDAAMPIAGPAVRHYDANGAIIVARSRADAIRHRHRIAPEHLVCDSAREPASSPQGRSSSDAGSAQAAGDYVTGSNHVLPTGGAARFRGGLSAADFVARVFGTGR
jgi:histidinol dehydrogenase